MSTQGNQQEFAFYQNILQASTHTYRQKPYINKTSQAEEANCTLTLNIGSIKVTLSTVLQRIFYKLVHKKNHALVTIPSSNKIVSIKKLYKFG